ncbi:probable serine/threonine-protein kinase WNK4 isoform X2 [Glycine soja]|uniref:probable serine/threonine-protein kinase WNK4 isoform X2 n=1 Tax=Glycine soja TaxID=3848 RepID=UPI0007190D80|nr:probable serine/threonine-protein kinase WNK4 isoform X2 [Glycine soja]|eukprot:XP_014626604.1 probable serine/threonine-protein kinase WNK4 isoform X2 [Glycine max]
MVGDILGKGAMKTVYKAIDEVLGIEVAWSQVKLNEALRKPEDLERLYLEVHLLSTLKHQSIMRFYTSWIDVDNKTFNFITEMFTSGTLREYRKKYKHIGLQAIKSWTRLILQGLVYLHEHDPPVIHRDLKCDNIFVNGHLGQVKIGDLGLAAILHGSQPAHSVIGTPEFMAPELYEEEYNELVDVYSFGMCVLEMLTSDYPYSECANPAQIYKKVTSGKLPASFFRIEDTEAQRFIGKCLITAAKRPSAKELLNDPFLLSDDASSMTKIGIQKPFLNYNEMEKLQLDDVSPRTEMSITGKLNPEHDTIFLKVQISDKDGSCRNVYFPFDIYTDTPIDVAMEMVKELEITDLKPSDIANMIEGEISVLLPNKRNSNCSVITMTTTTNHHFHSASSRSSSQGSISGSDSRADDLLNGDYWLHGDVLDDASSICSSHGTYSNSNFCSVDEQEENHKASTRKDKHLIIKSHMCTRFSPNEDPITLNQCKVLAGPQAPSTSKNKRMMDNRRLTRNKSLIDTRSQLLHRSLVEEVNKRRLFNTVGAVENIGFVTPYEVTNKKSHPACGAFDVNSSRSSKRENFNREKFF